MNDKDVNQQIYVNKKNTPCITTGGAAIIIKRVMMLLCLADGAAFLGGHLFKVLVNQGCRNAIFF